MFLLARRKGSGGFYTSLDNTQSQDKDRVTRDRATVRVHTAVQNHSMCKIGFLLISCIAVCTRSFGTLPPCSSDEAELAGKRVQTLAALSSVLRAFGSSETFSLDSFMSQLSQLFTPDISVIVPHGFGLFMGLNGAAEYLALQFSSVNVGLFAFNFGDTAAHVQALSVDGDTYTLGSTNSAIFFPTATPSLRLQNTAEVVTIFAPCRQPSAPYPYVDRSMDRTGR